MIYRCDCGKYFTEDQIEIIETTFESLYGVSSDFDSRHPTSYAVCPFCHCSCFEEIDLEDEEEICEVMNIKEAK